MSHMVMSTKNHPPKPARVVKAPVELDNDSDIELGVEDDEDPDYDNVDDDAGDDFEELTPEAGPAGPYALTHNLQVRGSH
jgi:hypothetical protein